MTKITGAGFIEKATGGNFDPVPAGTYDAYIHAIILTGKQEQQPEFKTGKPKPPDGEMRILFEIPKAIREDGQTSIIKKDILRSIHEKSYLFSLARAVFGFHLTVEELLEKDLEEFLGKPLSLNIIEWESKKGNKGNDVKKEGMNVLDPRLLALPDAAKATRETFVFTPYDPDLKIFNETLSFYTKKKIMEAVDNDMFPKELHEAWKIAQSENNNVISVNSNNNNKEIDMSKYNTAVIE